MSISLSSCLPSQLSQNNILSGRQSYFNDSLIGQVHDFGKDINQMENMITSMEEMSKDIRSHLLDLQTMPGAKNVESHFQQQTEHFESMVDDQLRSSLQRLSPVIMQSHLTLGTNPYSASQGKYQTPSREVYSTITGGHSPQKRTDNEFCTPPDFLEEPESRRQVQTNIGICQRRLHFEKDSEDRKVGFGNICPFTEEDHSYTNQTTVIDELNGSHFTACLDQGLKSSSSKEKSSDTSDARHSEIQTSTATPEPTENTKMINTEPVPKSEEKSEESTNFEDSSTNINLQDPKTNDTQFLKQSCTSLFNSSADLVSQAAKLLDNNGADLCIDTDSMVDTMLSEIRDAFNQNVEKVFKDVNTSELLSKQLQETNSCKMSSAKKTSLKVSNQEDNGFDVSFCDEKPEEYEMSEDMDDADYGHDDYYYCLPPSPSTTRACMNANFDSSSWRGHRAKEAWDEVKTDNVLWDSNRRKKKKKKEMIEEEVEEEEERPIICPYITGGVRPHKGHKIDPMQPRKKCICDHEKKHRHHQRGTNSNESEERLLFDAYDTNSSAEWTEITPAQYCNKHHPKHKKYGKKSQKDKKSREVHFSDTVYLIGNDGDVRESDILLPQGKVDNENRSRNGKYSNNGGHYQDQKAHQKQGKKLAPTTPSCVCSPRHEADPSHKPVCVKQERSMHDKSVMTPWDIPKPKPAASPVTAWNRECNDPPSPRTRTENWKCNSRVEDEQNGIFKSLTIESVSTDKTLPSNQWPTTRDHRKDNLQRNAISNYNIAGGCGHNLQNDQTNGNFPDWQVFDDSQSNLPCPGDSSESQMALVCCILPQTIQNSNNKNTDSSGENQLNNRSHQGWQKRMLEFKKQRHSLNKSALNKFHENVYISNMMLTDLKGEDLKNPQKIGQPIEASEAKKVSYLVRELMEHLHANENFLNNPPDRGMAAGTGSSPPGRKMSWVDAVKPRGKGSSPRLSQCGSPILFCYLPPEFLPKAHQVKSLKKPSKEPRKTTDTSPARDKVVKKFASFNKGCQTENNSRILNGGNPAGLSWWISAPPRVRKTPSSRIQQIYSNRLPPPVPMVTVKSVGKESRSSTPERKVKPLQSPYNKKARLGLNSSPTKKKPFLI